MYRGIFWIKNLENLKENTKYLLKIKTNLDGDALDFHEHYKYRYC
mgnify:CR=1 FL=1